jgi:type II secretory pathway pseudopilin PulG
MIRMPHYRSHRGFTLVQGLVVLGIAVILMGLLIPASQKARESAARTQSANSLHLLGISANTCAEQRNGHVPPAYGSWPVCALKDNESFFYRILSYQGDVQFFPEPDPNMFIKHYFAPLDSSNDGSSNKISYAVNSSVFVPNVGARYPRVFNIKGSSNQILFFERYAVTGYTTHTWSSVATVGRPQVAAVDASTADSCQFDVPSTEINVGMADRTAHAFTTAGFLVGLGDASTRLMNNSANNPYTYDTREVKDVTGTTFTWACDWKAIRPPPADGSW